MARPGKPMAYRAQCRNLQCKATFSLGQVAHDAALNHWDRRLLPEPLGDVPAVPCGACEGRGRKPLSEDHLILRGLLQSGGPSTVTKLHPLVMKRGLSAQMVNEKLSQMEALGMVRRRKRDGRSFLWESYEKEERAAEDEDKRRVKGFQFLRFEVDSKLDFKNEIRQWIGHNRFTVGMVDVVPGSPQDVVVVVRCADFPVVPVGAALPLVDWEHSLAKT